MNIEKWLYPKPKVTWDLSDYLDEILWVPVYGNRDSQGSPSPGKVIKLSTLFSESEQPNPKQINPLSGFTMKASHRKSDSNELWVSSEDTTSSNDQKVREADMLYQTQLGVLTSPLNSKDGTHGFHSLPEHLLDQSIHQDYSMRKKRSGWISSDEVARGPARPINPSLPIKRKIPCMLLRQNQYQDKVLIYLHSNAEDIHLCYQLCQHLMVQLNMCVLAMEYAGYSYYKEADTSEETICEDTVRMFDFLTDDLGVHPSRIGR